MNWDDVIKRAFALINGEDDLIACYANVSSLIHESAGYWWTGFYRVDSDRKQLVLGPFQGPVACTRIPYGRGVCGTSWKEERVIIVPDVEEFPGHIACSSLSRSEVVLPVRVRGEIIGVLDIDSKNLDEFSEEDAAALERICVMLGCRVRSEIIEYVEHSIIPRYDAFDKGHQRDHVKAVISQAMRLASFYDVDPELVYVAAAFHDTGLCEDRKTHHMVSGRIIREDAKLREWFSEEQVEIIAQAAEDHRASSDHEPRSQYSRIVAEADRQIIPETVIRRTIQYGLSHYPELDKEGNWQRTVEHLHEKYAEGGYLKLWVPESPNAARMAALRDIIKDEVALRTLFDAFYDEETR